MPLVQMLSPSMDTYNDGVVALMAPTPSRGVVGVDFSTDEGLEQVGRLAYRSLSLRAQDVQLATTEGFELSRKVRTRRAPNITPSLICRAADALYEVSYVDTDATSHYLYLTEIATDGTLDLVGHTVTYDELRQAHRTEVVSTVHVRKAALGYDRTVASAQDALEPTASLRVRACDYAGQTLCRRSGVTYTVTKVAGAGEWLTLSCLRKAAD